MIDIGIFSIIRFTTQLLNTMTKINFDKIAYYVVLYIDENNKYIHCVYDLYHYCLTSTNGIVPIYQTYFVDNRSTYMYYNYN